MLLDENLPRSLKRYLPSDLEVVTVGERGWSGKKNGALLRDAAVEFDFFLTTDQGIPHQQNLARIQIGVVIIQAPSNRLRDLLPLVPKIIEALKTLTPGQHVRLVL